MICITDPTQSSILSQVAASIGASVAKLHDGGIIHGDLTTSNLLLRAHSNSVVRLFLMYFCVSYSIDSYYF
jgi:tRNA A-37 threonylcarbamoyl transferase component Bud32